MVLTKALILKGLVGATSIVVPASLMIAYRKEISSYFSPSNLTKFDQGLIDYLNSGGDIQFKVTKGTEGTTDLTASDLDFTNTTNEAVISIKISTEQSANSGTLTDAAAESADSKAKKATLQRLNNKADATNGTAWTWICEIQLKREGSQGTNINSKYKDRILKETNKGLFGILKEAIGNDNQDSKKKIKQDFIRNCAESRTSNKTLNTTSNEIKTSKEDVIFAFQQKTGETDLSPKEETKFDKWFPKTQSTPS